MSIYSHGKTFGIIAVGLVGLLFYASIIVSAHFNYDMLPNLMIKVALGLTFFFLIYIIYLSVGKGLESSDEDD